MFTGLKLFGFRAETLSIWSVTDGLADETFLVLKLLGFGLKQLKLLAASFYDQTDCLWGIEQLDFGLKLMVFELELLVIMMKLLVFGLTNLVLGLKLLVFELELLGNCHHQ